MNDLPEIIYEDNHLLAFNKPAGLLVQGDNTGDTPLSEQAKEYIKRKYNKPGAVFLGVVHRLDRPVSGVNVFARTSKALSRMNSLFRERQTSKVYWAVVQSQPSKPEDKLIHWLIKNEKLNKTSVFKAETNGALRSELDYRLVKKIGNHFLLEVNPITGRSHQIRAQLSAIGCPIVGDLKYGFGTPMEDASIALHALELSFLHPVRQEMVTLHASPPPNDFWIPFL